MADKKIYDTIEKMEPIAKGFSGDKKYCVMVCDGTKYSLRIMPIEKYETWQNNCHIEDMILLERQEVLRQSQPQSGFWTCFCHT